MHNLSIRWQILLISGLLLLLACAGLLTSAVSSSHSAQQHISSSTNHMLIDAAQTNIEAKVSGVSQQMAEGFKLANRELEQLVLSTRVLHDNTGAEGFYNNTRKVMQLMMKGTLQNNQQLLGVYGVWLPNAIDGQDEVFANDAAYGSNEAGRFSSYWNRSSNGALSSETMDEATLNDSNLDHHGIAENEWFMCPVRTGSRCILDPYLDQIEQQGITKNVLMSSVAVPLIYRQQVVGTYGSDITLDYVSSQLNQANQKLYQGKGQMWLLSSNATVAGHSDNQNVGNKAASELQNLHRKAISNQQTVFQHAPEQQSYYLAQPFPLIEGAKPWVMIYSVPEAVMLAHTQTLSNILDQALSAQIQSSVLVTVVVLALGMVLLAWASSRITQPLGHVGNMLGDIASGNGDLTRKISYQSRNELGEVTARFNAFIEQLAALIRNVLQTAATVDSNSRQNLKIAEQNREAIARQQHSVMEISSAIRETSHASRDIARNVQEAASEAHSADSAAREGEKDFLQCQSQLQQLQQNISAAHEVIGKLREESERISGILNVIRTIAEQTNLLALNAAIESARAGEYGRGFAVVADEVRQLAQRTQDSTAEIEQMISALLEQASAATTLMDNSLQSADETSNGFAGSAEKMSAIAAAISRIAAMNEQIAAAAEEQSSVSDQLSDNVQIVEDSAANVNRQTDELAANIDQLAEASASLQAQLGQFKV